MVDGIDLQAFEVQEWRGQISTGFQDFVRFELRVRETVGVGDLEHIENQDVVEQALERAGASHLPTQLPNGLETQLGRDWENGIELSGGQWQQLALGRAMMRKHPLLLILDEPTASLDAQTEYNLFERYATASRRSQSARGAITVLVSHRFSTLSMADLIVVLAQGKVVEVGTHQKLMQQQGLYAELYEMQAQSYL